MYLAHMCVREVWHTCVYERMCATLCVRENVCRIVCTRECVPHVPRFTMTVIWHYIYMAHVCVRDISYTCVYERMCSISRSLWNTHACTHTNTHTQTHTHTYTHTHTCTYVYHTTGTRQKEVKIIIKRNTHAHTYTHIITHTHTCVCGTKHRYEAEGGGRGGWGENPQMTGILVTMLKTNLLKTNSKIHIAAEVWPKMLHSMHTNKHTDVLHAFMYAHIHTHTYTYVHTYTHTYVQTCKHTYKHTCIYIHIYTYKHTYINIHRHLKMHACIQVSYLYYHVHICTSVQAHLLQVSCCLRVHLQVHVYIHATCVQQKRFHTKSRTEFVGYFFESLCVRIQGRDSKSCAYFCVYKYVLICVVGLFSCECV